MYTFRPKVYRKFSRKTGDYTKIVSIFDNYKIGRVQKSQYGWETIEVIGPKQTFILIQTARPLTIIRPPEVEGGNAIQKKLPLYYVTSKNGCTKIQGACHFALDGTELIAYRSSGRGLVEEL